MPSANSQIANKKIAVILPITAQSSPAPRVINEIKIVLNALRVPFTLVVVRNGNIKSHLGEYLDAICYSETSIRCVTLGCRTTKQLAIRAGLAAVDADAYITLDADGTDDVRAISQMLQKWLKGADCVLAVRKEDEEGSSRRKWSKSLYRMVSRRVSVPLVYGAENYCLLDRRVVRALQDSPADDRSLSQQTARLGFQRSVIGMEGSWKRPASRITRAMNHFRQLRETVLSHSRLPVHTLYWCAASAIFLSFATGIFATVAMFYTVSTSLLLSVMISACLGTICSLSIGSVVIGEYLYRLLQNGPAAQGFAFDENAQACNINLNANYVPEQEVGILEDVNAMRATISAQAAPTPAPALVKQD